MMQRLCFGISVAIITAAFTYTVATAVAWWLAGSIV